MSAAPTILHSSSTLPNMDGAPPADQRYRITPPTGIRRMLTLPEAGDVVAKRWAQPAIVLYFLLGGLLVATVAGHESITEFLGLGANLNLMEFVLIVAGIATTFIAFGIVLKDIRHMRIEESDINWLARTGREGLPWVFIDPGEREHAFQHGWTKIPDAGANPVETLIDDRVRRVQRAKHDENQSRISIAEMRAIAEKRTSRYGEFARYLSSMLLLLAVLGTFAGVKSALPGLIDALVAQGGNGSLNTLRVPLIAVEDAFGGNALALVGALALSIAAQGLAFGRRNLLERLELISAEYVYGDETLATADPMQAAVNSLEASARDLRSLSATMTGVESSLTQLGDEFKGALGQLSDDLRDLTDRQHESLYSHTGQTLDALQRRVAEMAGAVEANAHSSARLIDSVQLRADDARAAIEELRRNHEQMATVLDTLGSTAANSQRMFEQADERFRLMTTAADKLSVASDNLSSHVADLHTVVAGVGSVTEKTAESFAASLASKVADLRDTVEAATAVNKGMGDTLGAVLAQVRDGESHTHELLLGVKHAIEGGSARVPAGWGEGSPAVRAAQPAVAATVDMTPVLHELKEISAQLHALEMLRSEQRAARWAIPGALTLCTAIVVAAMEYLARAR